MSDEETRLSDEGKVQFVLSTLSPMSWHTLPYLASIIGVDDDAHELHVGSAFRVSAGQQKYLVTAAHVMRQAKQRFTRFGVSAADGAAPAELTERPFRFCAQHDLAVLELPSEYVVEEGCYWPLGSADPDDRALSSDYLFLHGFPGTRSKFSALANGLVNQSFPYGVMRRHEDLPSGVLDFEFAMDFDPSNMRNADDEPTDWLDPHGLSGSPVWRIGASGHRVDEWEPAKSKLVGIVTRWLPDDKLLLATKVQHLISLVLGSESASP